MVIDLHLLNQFTLADSFKMESVNSIRLALRRGEWAASIDLSDAYLHIHIGTVLLHASDRNGVLSLLSRGTSVPRVPGRFTVSGQHPSQCRQQVESVTFLIRYLGFLINVKKSELTPSQEFIFLE